MQAHEEVLSEFHVGAHANTSGTVVTRVSVRGLGSGEDDHLADSDGESTESVSARRRPRKKRRSSTPASCGEACITISHRMATPLDDVGLQVWQGAMLLSDTILGAPDVFQGRGVLELGCGAGLSSCAARIVGASVIATDYKPEICALARANLALNDHLYRQGPGDDHGVELSKANSGDAALVRVLDWGVWMKDGQGQGALDAPDRLQARREGPGAPPSSPKLEGEVAVDCLPSTPKVPCPFLWDEKAAGLLSRCPYIVAADVVYSKALTASLFVDCLPGLLSAQSGRRLFLTIEKRINFHLDRLDVAAPEYDDFKSYLCEVDPGPAEASSEWSLADWLTRPLTKPGAGQNDSAGKRKPAVSTHPGWCGERDRAKDRICPVCSAKLDAGTARGRPCKYVSRRVPSAVVPMCVGPAGSPRAAELELYIIENAHG